MKRQSVFAACGEKDNEKKIIRVETKGNGGVQIHRG